MSNPLYRALDQRSRQIRLLSLLPAAWPEDIRCLMYPDSLDREPMYEAISYVWGESKENRSIWVNDTPVQVTDNLYKALVRIRRQNEKRTLWIDQICINQSDNVERGAQVSLMSSIFGGCLRALLWLGDHSAYPASVSQVYLSKQVPFIWLDTETGKPNDGFNQFQSLIRDGTSQNTADHVPEAFILLQALSLDTHLKHVAFIRLGDPEYTEASSKLVLTALRSLFSQPWWSRIWTVQECVLPHHAIIMYGPFTLNWRAMLKAGLLYRQHAISCCSDLTLTLSPLHRTILEDFSTTLAEIDKLRDNVNRTLVQTSPSSFTEVLKQFQDRQATERVDKIYGLLGLAGKWARGICVDYTLSATDVYEQLTFQLITKSRSLDIFVNSPRRENRDAPECRFIEGRGNPIQTNIQMPSWIEHWAHNSTWTDSDRYSLAKLYNASCGIPPDAIYVNHVGGSAISLSGLRIGTVTSTSAIFCSLTTRSGIFRKWYSNIKKQKWGDPYTTIHFLKTITGYGRYATQISDSKPFGGFMVIPSRIDCSTEIDWCFDKEPGLASDFQFSSSRTVESSPYTIDNVERAVRATTTRRRFFKISFRDSKTKYITFTQPYGLGPDSVATGDIVCILYGGKTPFLLRPIGEREFSEFGKRKCFQLIGNCFVHGIMFGEYMDQ